MGLTELKVVAWALLLPPAGPLLVVLVGLLLAWRSRRAAGLVVGLAGTMGLWLISCNGFAIGLAHSLLPPPPPLSVARMKSGDVQAVVVVGAGVLRESAEYGIPQPNYQTLMRLRYGVWLARHTDKPLAFVGGVAPSADVTAPSDGVVARRVAAEEFGFALHWMDDRSRDSAEYARNLRDLTRADGLQRIALVSDAFNMGRAVQQFERAGFTVMPAPVDYASPQTRPLLEWTPSSQGLSLSRRAIREWLSLRSLGG